MDWYAYKHFSICLQIVLPCCENRINSNCLFLKQERVTIIELKKIFRISITTYIHPLNQDYDPAFHITYVVCVNFIHEKQNPQFKVGSERQSFEKLFMTILFTIIFTIGHYNPS